MRFWHSGLGKRTGGPETVNMKHDKGRNQINCADCHAPDPEVAGLRYLLSEVKIKNGIGSPYWKHSELVF